MKYVQYDHAQIVLRRNRWISYSIGFASGFLAAVLVQIF